MDQRPYLFEEMRLKHSGDERISGAVPAGGIDYQEKERNAGEKAGGAAYFHPGTGGQCGLH